MLNTSINNFLNGLELLLRHLQTIQFCLADAIGLPCLIITRYCYCTGGELWLGQHIRRSSSHISSVLSLLSGYVRYIATYTSQTPSASLGARYMFFLLLGWHSYMPCGQVEKHDLHVVEMLFEPARTLLWSWWWWLNDGMWLSLTGTSSICLRMQLKLC
jgi:hypothetical protein